MQKKSEITNALNYWSRAFSLVKTTFGNENFYAYIYAFCETKLEFRSALYGRREDDYGFSALRTITIEMTLYWWSHRCDGQI